MEPRHKKLYIQWCQSPRVELWTGPSDRPHSSTFVFPSELLRRRSQPFRKLFEQSLSDDGKSIPAERIELSDTPVETIEDFFIWSLSPEPQINKHATFKDVVRLGIFAWKYQIHALSNQATDMIRSKLASNAWQLRASLVDEVYAATATPPTGVSVSQLREVTCAALNQVPRSIVENEEAEERKEWKTAFLKHAQLGWDYIEAGAKEWSREGFMKGVCQFHVHEKSGPANEEFTEEDVCPYGRDDCYPATLEEQGVNGVVHETVEVNGLAEEINGKGLESSTSISGNVIEEPVASEVVAHDVSAVVASPLPEPLLGDESGTEDSRALSEEKEKTTNLRTVDGAKRETEASRTTIYDEVNETLTWDKVIGNANSSRTHTSKTVNGGVDKIGGQPELEVKTLNETALSPKAVSLDEPLVANGKMNGSDASKAAVITISDEKSGETLGDKNVEESGVRVGKRGKKKKNSIK